MKFGVKTRINIPHTCGTDGRHIVPIRHNYIPTREELEKYLARLKELMEEEYPNFSACIRLLIITDYDRKIAQYKDHQRALALGILADMKNHTNNEEKANDNG